MNNIDLTMAQRRILEGIRTALSNVTEKATEIEQSEKENKEEMPGIIKAIVGGMTDRGPKIEMKELSFADFLKMMSEIEDMEDDNDENTEEITEEDIKDFFEFLSAISSDDNEEDDEDDVCPWCCSDCENCTDEDDDLEKYRVFDFKGMIKEFEDGYNKLFTDGTHIYGYDSGTLLEVFESGVQPADITSDMLTRIYMKKEGVKAAPIDNEDVLAYVLDGDTASFTLDIDGIHATGTLSCSNGIPSYKIDNQTGMNNSDLILLAIFKGKWTV